MVKDKRMRKLILEIVEKIKDGYQPEKIILFGSYAYGLPTEDSDIDLFIVKETEDGRINRTVEVSRLVRDWGRRVSISPLVYTPRELQDRLDLGDQFLQEIMNRGEILYAR